MLEPGVPDFQRERCDTLPKKVGIKMETMLLCTLTVYIKRQKVSTTRDQHVEPAKRGGRECVVMRSSRAWHRQRTPFKHAC